MLICARCEKRIELNPYDGGNPTLPGGGWADRCRGIVNQWCTTSKALVLLEQGVREGRIIWDNYHGTYNIFVNGDHWASNPDRQEAEETLKWYLMTKEEKQEQERLSEIKKQEFLNFVEDYPALIL